VGGEEGGGGGGGGGAHTELMKAILSLELPAGWPVACLCGCVCVCVGGGGGGRVTHTTD